MVVSDIKRQAKRNERYSIYVDGSYAFSLDELELSGSNLRVGLELSQEEVETWRARSAAGKAYDAALRYLSYRRRSRHEMLRHLEDKEFDPATVTETLEHLAELGMINDEAFATAWVADRNRLRPRSRIALRAELMAKGIERETIDAAIAEIGRDGEIEALRSLIEQKRSRYSDETKLMAYLASRGYDYGLVKAALASEEAS